jgi:hypothetical protein
MTVPEPTLHAATSVTPAPTDEEAVAIVAAMEVLWPKPVVAVRESVLRDRAWKFSGRWWARPVAIRRDRPWH